MAAARETSGAACSTPLGWYVLRSRCRLVAGYKTGCAGGEESARFDRVGHTFDSSRDGFAIDRATEAYSLKIKMIGKQELEREIRPREGRRIVRSERKIAHSPLESRSEWNGDSDRDGEECEPWW